MTWNMRTDGALRQVPEPKRSLSILQGEDRVVSVYDAGMGPGRDRRLDWDDLKILNALAEAGSFAAAARALGLSQATISRRLRGLEERIGHRLVERGPDGHALTPEGAALRPLIGDMAKLAVEVDRRLDGLAPGPAGVVRIAAGSWLARFLARHAAVLSEGLPHVTLDIIGAYDFADMSRHEADIALRNVRPDGGRLVVRRLASRFVAVYGHRDYVEANPPARDEEARFQECRWIGFVPGLAHLPTAQWLEARLRRPPELRVSQAMAILDAIEGKNGLGLVSCHEADSHEDLVRLTDPINTGDGLWMVIHEDLRDVPRVRCVADRLVTLIEAHRPAFEGREMPAS